MLKKSYKRFVNATFYCLSFFFLYIRAKLQKFLGVVTEYQPDPFKQKQFVNSKVRICEDRFQAFQPYLPKFPFSALDIGCNQGYFIFRMATFAGVCIGVEKAYNEIMYARSLAEIHRVKNVSFLNWNVTPDNILCLPSVDVIICLSIFHHWVRDFGENSAKEMLNNLGKLCKKMFIFETGQYEEKGKKWTDNLHFMSPNSHEWVLKYLKSIDFSDVKIIGEFPTTVTDVPRKLYVAIK